MESAALRQPHLEHMRRVYLYFADLLDYPEAAERIQDFVDFAESTPLGRMEEIYTGTFDVNPACYIFAGYMLFGESFKRGKFLVRLQEKYREYGFDPGNELADHLALMFRFMALLDLDGALAQQLLKDCFVPVLQTMIGGFKKDTQRPNPYAQTLRAILDVLEQTEKTRRVSETLRV